MSAPAWTCITLTVEQWDMLLQLVVLMPLVSVAVYAFVAHWGSWEYRVRRFLRRRRIRVIRVRREAV